MAASRPATPPRGAPAPNSLPRAAGPQNGSRQVALPPPQCPGGSRRSGESPVLTGATEKRATCRLARRGCGPSEQPGCVWGGEARRLEEARRNVSDGAHRHLSTWPNSNYQRLVPPRRGRAISLSPFYRRVRGGPRRLHSCFRPVSQRLILAPRGLTQSLSPRHGNRGPQQMGGLCPPRRGSLISGSSVSQLLLNPNLALPSILARLAFVYSRVPAPAPVLPGNTGVLKHLVKKSVSGQLTQDRVPSIFPASDSRSMRGYIKISFNVYIKDILCYFNVILCYYVILCYFNINIKICLY